MSAIIRRIREAEIELMKRTQMPGGAIYMGSETLREFDHCEEVREARRYLRAGADDANARRPRLRFWEGKPIYEVVEPEDHFHVSAMDEETMPIRDFPRHYDTIP